MRTSREQMKERFFSRGLRDDMTSLFGQLEGVVQEAGRKVVQLRRLRWNFRGCHTIFLDGGAPVDVTWDLHGWLFHAHAPAAELPHSSSSCAVFTFQARGASEAKLWTDDDCFDDGEEAA